jgi:hypothetical protein
MWSAGARMFEKVGELISASGDPALIEAARRAGSRLTYEEALAMADPA